MSRSSQKGGQVNDGRAYGIGKEAAKRIGGIERLVNYLNQQSCPVILIVCACSAQLARKNEEDRAREQQARTEKKAEKEKRRAEAASAKQHEAAMTSKAQIDKKSRTAVDDVKNGTKGQKLSQRQKQQAKIKAVQGNITVPQHLS